MFNYKTKRARIKELEKEVAKLKSSVEYDRLDLFAEMFNPSPDTKIDRNRKKIIALEQKVDELLRYLRLDVIKQEDCPEVEIKPIKKGGIKKIR
jgi:hypothetical protein